MCRRHGEDWLLPYGLSGLGEIGCVAHGSCKARGLVACLCVLFFVDCESGSGASLGAQDISGGLLCGGCCGVSVLVLARVSDPGCAVAFCKEGYGATECWCGCSGQRRFICAELS